MRLNALFRLAFATAPPHGLTLPHTITRRLILQKARGHFTSARRLTALPRLVGTRFQVLFHDPSPGHFSPFPHGTGPLSVIRKYSGLPGGPGRFTRDFTSPVLLGNTLKRHRRFAYRTLTVYGRPSQIIRLHLCFLTLRHPSGNDRRVPQPRTRNARRLEHVPGLASSAFAHHYSRNHTCFLFLRVLRCFTSPRSHQPVYTFNGRRHPMTSARLPHSETPGSKSGCRLPEAYRRLPRPSSAPDAKASTVRPQKLEHTKQSEETAKPKENTKQPPPRKEGSHRSLSVKRCSRPLYSSQTTTSTRPQPP